MSKRRTKQQWLLQYKNPLLKKLGQPFFSELPKTPGVYQMYSKRDKLLYVGKAKNLRNRLQTYKRAKPGESPRKVLRLLKVVHTIKWESCKTELEALLLENKLLRTHKPPFNIVNTRPETYYFIHFTVIGTCQVHFQLTTNPNLQTDATRFGAFKGRYRVREAYLALLRLLWACEQRQQKRFSFPQILLREKPPYTYALTLNTISVVSTQEFLLGKSQALLEEIIGNLLSKDNIPKFMYSVIQNDLLTLEEFYDLGPKRNFAIHQKFKLDTPLIPQTELDDYLVKILYKT